ncbi:amidohydrolase family protein, partial [Nocardia exalbida]|uniref:amidohydrolase family protein n=1 Tax=Nocardia exalbida TaxID=290231 RepID=UPI0014615702
MNPRPPFESFFDTTRAVTDLVLSGTLERYPSMRIIVPHAGAVLPALASRIDVLASKATGKPELMHRALRLLHFDLAGMPLPDQLPALLNVADPARIHYGSDWSFTPLPEIRANKQQLEATTFPDGRPLAAATYENSTA